MTNQECLQSWRAYFAARCALCPVHQVDVALAQLLLEVPPPTKEPPAPAIRKSGSAPPRRARQSRQPARHPARPVKAAATRPRPNAPTRAAGFEVFRRAKGKYDAVILDALRRAPSGLKNVDIAHRLKCRESSTLRTLARLVAAKVIRREGWTYLLARPATESRPSGPSVDVVWNDRKGDPPLQGGVRPA